MTLTLGLANPARHLGHLVVPVQIRRRVRTI